MHEMKKEEARAILVAIDDDKPNFDIEASLEELAQLAKTAEIEVVDVLVQKRGNPHPGTYLGKGKLDELQDLIDFSDEPPNILIFNDELSPAQFRSLTNKFDCNIIDRSILILDIFAMGAASAEGKLQVELAQLNYRLSRLTGMGKMLSRLGGGIGTRGPGETKLETDRRHIRNRIGNLKEQLAEIRKNRDTMRKKRKKQGVFVAALVGYTNAGKSSILNMLAEEDEVYAADKLFATLDTTMRRLQLPGGGAEILLSDTVGFIEKLPHHLIQAFKATLEELHHADVLIFVQDNANAQRDKQRDVVVKTLNDLDLNEKSMIVVYNKMDKETNNPLPKDFGEHPSIKLSAKTGQGKAELLEAITEIYNAGKSTMGVVIPYEDGKIQGYIHQNCEILAESHEENGIFFEIVADEEARNRLETYKI